jgi:hypothetical protein
MIRLASALIGARAQADLTQEEWQADGNHAGRVRPPRSVRIKPTTRTLERLAAETGSKCGHFETALAGRSEHG